MTVVLLAGPPAVGHNTVAEQLVRRRERISIIDGDEIRATVRSPAFAVGDGDEWERQYRLCIRSMCALARLHDADGNDVILLDVVEPYVLPLFRQELIDVSALSVVLLIADAETLAERDRARDPLPASAAQEAWHQRIRYLQATLSAAADLFDHQVDSTQRTIAETVRTVTALLGW